MRRTAICQVKVGMRWERRFGRFLVDDAGWVPRREKGRGWRGLLRRTGGGDDGLVCVCVCVCVRELNEKKGARYV
jgi:hypothetical protein